MITTSEKFWSFLNEHEEFLKSITIHFTLLVYIDIYIYIDIAEALFILQLLIQVFV